MSWRKRIELLYASGTMPPVISIAELAQKLCQTYGTSLHVTRIAIAHNAYLFTRTVDGLTYVGVTAQLPHLNGAAQP